MNRIVIVVMVMFAAAQQVTAQVFTTPKGGAENVTFEQVGGGTVHIVYDLVSSDPRAVFAVTLDASQDRGATFTVRPSSVSGDVGAGVKPGTGKRIVWESGRDVERLEIDQFRFRISAQAGPLKLQKADQPAPVAPVAAAPTPAAAPTTQTAAAKPKGGGSAKWLLIGGGAAAAAGVAAASGGGSGGGSTPTASTPGNTPAAANRAPVISARSHDFQAPGAVALVLVTDITFEVFATDDDGNAMTALWTFGDGTTATAPVSSGRAVTQKTYASGGLHRPTVSVGDGRGGNATSDYQQLTANTVTGLYIGTAAPAGFTVRLNLVQNGTAVTGDYVDGQGRSATVSSQLRAPRTMEMTLTYRGGGSDIYTVVFAADLKALTAPSRAGTTLTLARQP
ncbi:MAG: PKD domain-containing protein [Acidobacteriota bacterium]|nr:PKD domain-containing protein [Acidobacteriota bacterium]